MTQLIAVAKVLEIPPGGMKVVEVESFRIALCHVEGTIYAIEDVCTHDDGPLGEGTLRGGQVECPRHGARFDVKTGKAVRMPAIVPVRTFPVKVENGEIFVEMVSGVEP
ncbi:MAG: non-heme iron oxygenase ferredoxin subunit [Elusimicrobia bacterium]|nr:non-heme iron oxygenase ferredoxin subunit [Elusimicrobiota bacterium]